MDIALALIVLVALLAAVWFLLRWLFARKERKKAFRSRFLLALLAMIVSFGAFGFLIGNQDSQLALEAGFADAASYRAARDAGIDDPAQWAAVLAERQAEAARRAESEAADQARRDQEAAEAAEAAAAARAQQEAEAARQAEIEVAQAAERDAFYSVPDDQRRFVEAVTAAAATAREAENDLQRGAARRDRKAAMCAVVSGSAVRGWTGTIRTLTTNGEGKGVLGVAIGGDAVLKTWNNAFSDTFDATLIEPTNPMFDRLAQLSRGDRVRFDATLFRTPDGPDCFEEQSLTLSGSLRDPGFTTRFERIERFEDGQ